MTEGSELLPAKNGYAPCPTCGQYSHSIGTDALAAAFNHFQSMYAHPVRGHPMGHNFDETTRDAAQVLMAATTAAEKLVEAIASVLPIGDDRARGDRVILLYIRMDELRSIRALVAAYKDQTDG